MESIPYNVGHPELVMKEDEDLRNDLMDLRTELEDNDFLHDGTKVARCLIFSDVVVQLK